MSHWEKVLTDNIISSDINHSKLLLLGDRKSGKSTFIQSTFNTNPTTDILLSYNYFPFRDIETNDHLLDLDIYSVSEALDITSHIFSKEYSLDTLCCIFLSWEEPQLFIENIEKWLKFLLDVVDLSLKRKYTIVDKENTIFIDNEDPNFKKVQFELNEARTKLKRALQLLRESQEKSDTFGKDLSRLDLVPLNEGSLEVNLGIPIVFITSKVDVCLNVGDELEITSAKYGFIMQAIRKVSLTMGAALIALNNKLEQSRNELYSYLLYRLNPASFKFNSKIDGINLESLVIPAGWDSLPKIKTISNTSNLEESFLLQMTFENCHHDVKISGRSYFRKQFPSDTHDMETVFSINCRMISEKHKVCQVM
eukprot:NODE_74_length_24438_cov_0.900283.p7 type:complete len:366 gc:universal NODE_74_length_24438_cov_0.900283:12370-13467(+)